MSFAAPCVGLAALVGGGILSAADGALLSLDRDGRDSGATPGSTRTAREPTHRSLSIGRLLGHLVVGAAIGQAVDVPARPELDKILLVAALVVTAVVLVEASARSVGYTLGGRALARLSPVVRLVEILVSPIVALGARVERMLYRLVPPPTAGAADRETSAEQFREVVAAEADVSVAEEALIHGVFSLNDTEVREIMVPRVDIVGVDATMPWSEALDRVRSFEHARFPVYDGTLDNVVGILYAKDLLPAVVVDEEPAGGWTTLMRPAVFVPTSKPIDAQLHDFKVSHTHIAIVSDEYGGTAGLVTIEDVLEEIVGEIHDEYDEENRAVEREGDTRFWVAGGVGVSELSDLLETEFGPQDVATVGGLVYSLFGRVPRAGESVSAGGYRIVVECVRRRRVERVYFERIESVPARPRP